MYIEQLQQRYMAEAGFKEGLRKALFPILLTLTGCGTEDKEPKTKSEPETNPISVPSPSPSYTPTKSTTSDWENDIERQISVRGWGCTFKMTSKLTLVLGFEKELANQERVFFSFLFMRDDEKSPWYLEENRPIAPARQADDPEINKMRNDVMSIMNTSLNEIKTKYQCNIEQQKWSI